MGFFGKAGVGSRPPSEVAREVLRQVAKLFWGRVDLVRIFVRLVADRVLERVAMRLVESVGLRMGEIRLGKDVSLWIVGLGREWGVILQVRW